MHTRRDDIRGHCSGRGAARMSGRVGRCQRRLVVAGRLHCNAAHLWNPLSAASTSVLQSSCMKVCSCTRRSSTIDGSVPLCRRAGGRVSGRVGEKRAELPPLLLSRLLLHSLLMLSSLSLGPLLSFPALHRLRREGREKAHPEDSPTRECGADPLDRGIGREGYGQGIVEPLELRVALPHVLVLGRASADHQLVLGCAAAAAAGGQAGRGQELRRNPGAAEPGGGANAHRGHRSRERPTGGW